MISYSVSYDFGFHLFSNVSPSSVTPLFPFLCAGGGSNNSYHHILLQHCVILQVNKPSSPLLYTFAVATLTWPSVGVKPNTWKSWGFGILRDSRMFRARQQGEKHLALGCFWCHWKDLET